jgi:ankyrin repeat protein
MFEENICIICQISYDNFTRLKCSLHISSNGKSHYCCSTCLVLLKTDACPICRCECDLLELKINLGHTKNVLVDAILKKNTKIALMLIERNIDINYFDINGVPILMYSCSKSLDEVSTELIKSNYDKIINKHYMEQNSYDILMMCCENNLILTVKEFIKCIKVKNEYEDVLNIKDENGHNLIVNSMKNNRYEIFIELFQFYINDGHKDKNITCIIIKGLQLGVEELLIKFIDYLITNVEYNFDYIIDNCHLLESRNIIVIKSSLLIIACYYKQSNVALKLIDIYEKMEEKYKTFKIDYSDKNDNTVLSIACENELTDVALRLIREYCKNGTNTSEYKKLGAVNNDGNTPLSIACQKKLSSVALEILKTGRANQAVHNNIQMTPLMYACENKLEEVALEILKLGKCNIDIRDIVYNKDALSWACDKKLKNVANEILNYYKMNRINLKFIVDNDWNTPLILACKNRMSDIAIKIIEFNGNIFYNNNLNNRALNYAKKNRLTNVVEKIEKKLNSIK